MSKKKKLKKPKKGGVQTTETVNPDPVPPTNPPPKDPPPTPE
jgi:hypothetical protein